MISDFRPTSNTSLKHVHKIRHSNCNSNPIHSLMTSWWHVSPEAVTVSHAICYVSAVYHRLFSWRQTMASDFILMAIVMFFALSFTIFEKFAENEDDERWQFGWKFTYVRVRASAKIVPFRFSRLFSVKFRGVHTYIRYNFIYGRIQFAIA